VVCTTAGLAFEVPGVVHVRTLDPEPPAVWTEKRSPLEVVAKLIVPVWIRVASTFTFRLPLRLSTSLTTRVPLLSVQASPEPVPQVTGWPLRTVIVAVETIVHVSPLPGATPPTHDEPASAFPPIDVEVIDAAQQATADSTKMIGNFTG
jgi:hypothetical protein